MTIRSIWALLCAAVPCAAQPLVFPTAAATAEGETSVGDHRGGAPWWANPDQTPGASEFRMQLISDLPSTFNGTISELRFRRDGAILPELTLQSFFSEIEVTLATSGNTAASASTTFANNLGADATLVLPRQPVLFGAQQFNATFPEPFGYRIRLATPFPYNAANGSLVMQVVHWKNDLMDPNRLTQATRDLDAMTNSTEAAWLSAGSRCFSPRRWSPAIELRPSLSVDPSTNRLNFHATRHHAEHHSRGFLFGALDIVGFGQGFPVSTLPPSFNGCGTIDLDLTTQIFFGITGSNEYGQARWPTAGGPFWSVNYSPAFIGFKFWIQELNFDVHTQDYAVSAPVMVQTPTYVGTGQPFGLRTVWAEGAGSTTAVTGTTGTFGLGPVIEYR